MRLKVKRSLAVLFAIIFVLAGLSSCEPKRESKNIKGLFFSVEKDGKLSYLGGSIHYSKYPLKFPKSVDEAFNASDRLAVEIDITDPKVEQEIGLKLAYSKGDTLKNHITKETGEYIKPFLNEVKVSNESISNLKPWAVYSAIMGIQLNQLKYFPGLGIDKTLINLAKQEKKEIYSIETIEEQIKAISFDESDEFGNALLSTITSIDEVGKNLDEMSNIVFNGDLQGVNEINITEGNNYEGILKEWNSYVLDERNKNMSERIDKLFKEDKTTFVIIGAGHLAGDNGVIKLLESKGYKITQMN